MLAEIPGIGMRTSCMTVPQPGCRTRASRMAAVSSSPRRPTLATWALRAKVASIRPVPGCPRTRPIGAMCCAVGGLIVETVVWAAYLSTCEAPAGDWCVVLPEVFMPARCAAIPRLDAAEPRKLSGVRCRRQGRSGQEDADLLAAFLACLHEVQFGVGTHHLAAVGAVPVVSV